MRAETISISEGSKGRIDKILTVSNYKVRDMDELKMGVTWRTAASLVLAGCFWNCRRRESLTH